MELRPRVCGSDKLASKPGWGYVCTLMELRCNYRDLDQVEV